MFRYIWVKVPYSQQWSLCPQWFTLHVWLVLRYKMPFWVFCFIPLQLWVVLRKLNLNVSSMAVRYKPNRAMSQICCQLRTSSRATGLRTNRIKTIDSVSLHSWSVDGDIWVLSWKPLVSTNPKSCMMWAWISLTALLSSHSYCPIRRQVSKTPPRSDCETRCCSKASREG